MIKVRWLRRQKNTTAVHAFIRGNALSLCSLIHQLGDWKKDDSPARCILCERRLEKLNADASY